MKQLVSSLSAALLLSTLGVLAHADDTACRAIHAANVATGSHGVQMKMSGYDFAAMTPQIYSQGVHSCSQMRDEQVDGSAATVYRERYVADFGNTDATIWIAKSTGKLLREEQDGQITGKGRGHIAYHWAAAQPLSNSSADSTGNAIGSLLGTDAKGKADIGSALGKLTQAGGQIEQHDQARGDSGTPDAADTQQAMGALGGLLGALGGSLGGAQRHDPVDFHVLVPLLPAALPGMQRGMPKGSTDQALGIKSTSAEVEFRGAGKSRIEVSIKDASAISGLAGIAEMANASESEQGDNYEKNEVIGGQNVHETWDAGAHHGELSLIVGKRFGVDVTGDGVDMNALKNALQRIDLHKIATLVNANPVAQ